jgi:hypothetical protein
MFLITLIELILTLMLVANCITVDYSELFLA